MYRALCIVCILSVGLAVVSGAAIAQVREQARPGAFVRYSVNSVDGLIDQVLHDPLVAARYSRHFGVSKEKLATYFKANLRVGPLTAPLKVTTYFISKNGRILSKQRTLAAGRRVFLTSTNQVLLETGCGNPVRKSMPKPVTKVKASVESVGEPPVAVETLPSPVEAVEPPADIEELIQPEVVAQLPAVEAIVEPAVAFKSGLSFLDIMEGVAPVLAGLQYVEARKDSTTYVPEPGSFVPVALGSLGLASALIRKRRSSR